MRKKDMKGTPKNRKAQIATEFLNTYAWAVVAVFVAIAALWALGVFNAQPPQSCFLGDGLSCSDFAVDASGRLHLDVGQGTGRAIIITGVGCSVNDTPAIISVPPVTLQNKQHAFVTTSEGIPCTGAQTSAQAFRGTIAVQYRASDLTFNQTSKGDISSPFASASFNGSGSGAPTPTPVPPSGTILQSCPVTISAPGTYVLNSNLASNDSCITVNSNGTGAIINCGGHTITGSTEGTGILVDNVPDVVVQNCVIVGFYYGLYANYSPRTTFLSNSVTNSDFECIRVYQSSNATLSQNNATDCVMSRGIDLRSSHNSQISGNRVHGLEVYESNYVNVTGNTLYDYSYGVWVERALGTTLINNNCSENSVGGIYLVNQVNSSIVTGNTANNNGEFGFRGRGYSYNNLISNNTFNNNGLYGIVIYGNTNFDSNNFTGNTARYNGLYGFNRTSSGSSTRLTSNNFCNNNHTTLDANCTVTSTDGGANTCRSQASCGLTCSPCT